MHMYMYPGGSPRCFCVTAAAAVFEDKRAFASGLERFEHVLSPSRLKFLWSPNHLQIWRRGKMGRSRSRSRSRSRGRRDKDREERRRARPSDDFSSSRDFDREERDRRDIDYRGERKKDTDDYRERGDRDRKDRDRDRSRSRSRDRKDRSRSRSRDRKKKDKKRGSRSRSRSRSPKRKEKKKREEKVEVDEFGRVIDHRREKSRSPDRGRPKFDPRTIRRSESPERDAMETAEEELPPPMAEYQVNPEDDPETAAAKMEMEMMAKMGIPVGFDSTKGKGNAQTDALAMQGGVRIKPQRQPRQYMNRRCGFNKPLPAEPTRAVKGIGTKHQEGNNVTW